MDLFKKLVDARKIIRSRSMKKEGYNKYSNYYYFTPEQVSELVYDACSKTGIIDIFNMQQTEKGLFSFLDIINVDKPAEKITFQMPAEIPQITATNAMQQIGGSMTFSERYLKMTAFGISDNSLDFDSHNNTNKKELKKTEKSWLNYGTENYKKVILYIKNGGDIKEVKKKYRISKEVENTINNDINS